MAKTHKAIYLEAGRLIAEGLEDFACNAIRRASKNKGSALADFEKAFKPEGAWGGWLSDEEINYSTDEEQARQRRVVALCLCAVSTLY